MVAESYFVAPAFLSLTVKMPASHARAKVAGVFLGFVGYVENIRIKKINGYTEFFCICFDLSAVFRIVAGIHAEKNNIKGNVGAFVKLLHELCEKHGVFSAGDTHGDFVALVYELVSLDGGDEGIPQFLAVFFYYASFYELFFGKFPFHSFPLFVKYLHILSCRYTLSTNK